MQAGSILTTELHAVSFLLHSIAQEMAGLQAAKSDPHESSMSVFPLAPASIEFLPFRPSFHLPLRFNINSTLPDHPDLQDCRLHLDVSLPDALFIDPDEIRDAMHPGIEWSLEPDVVDIERPVRLDADPTYLYLSLPAPAGADPGVEEEEGTGRLDMTVKVPMHARYLRPNDHGRETIWLFTEEEPLRGGWVCRADEQHGQFRAVGGQYRDLMTGTLPVVPTMPISVMLPTGKPSHQPLVEVGTMAVVWACFGYLAWKIWKTSLRLRAGRDLERKTA
jgi:hypothetical protein